LRVVQDHTFVYGYTKRSVVRQSLARYFGGASASSTAN